MKWIVQYRKKGENKLRSEIVDVQLDTKRKVRKWWLSKTSTFVNCIGSETVGGHRQDNEFVNCFKAIL